MKAWPRTLGLLGLLLAVAALACWFVAFSPTLFLLGIVVLPTLSLLLLTVAALMSSRWWFAALVLPLFLLAMIPQYEQTTRVNLKSFAPDDVSFQFSGTFTVGAVTVRRYSPDVQSPEDERFIIWRIEPADQKSADRAAWEVNTVRYGVVPTGYVQVIPERGAPPPLQRGTVYRVNAAFCGRYFKVLDGTPTWVPTPSDAPCFAKKEGGWTRIPCPPIP